jgi:nitroalkane oxidase
MAESQRTFRLESASFVTGEILHVDGDQSRLLAMPIDFTLTPEQQHLRVHARAFARDVLSTVVAATQDLPTPLARFAATQPFYQQAVAAGFLRRLIPAPLGGQGTGVVDMAVLAEEFHAVKTRFSPTARSSMSRI